MVSVIEIIRIKSSDLYNSVDRGIYIELATDRTSQTFFGSKYNYAIALRACHIYEIATNDKNDNVAGSITTKSEGDLSISYSKSSTSKNYDDLSVTKYGRELSGLINAGSSISVTGNIDRLNC